MLESLLLDCFEVKQAILQMNFLLSQVKTEIVKLTVEGNNEEKIKELIRFSFDLQQLILQLAYILSLIQAEIVRLSSQAAA